MAGGGNGDRDRLPQSPEERLRLVEREMAVVSRYRSNLRESRGTWTLGIVAQVSRYIEAWLMAHSEVLAKRLGLNLDAELRALFPGASLERATAGQLAAFLTGLDASVAKGSQQRRLLEDLHSDSSCVRNLVRARNALLHAYRHRFPPMHEDTPELRAFREALEQLEQLLNSPAGSS